VCQVHRYYKCTNTQMMFKMATVRPAVGEPFCLSCIPVRFKNKVHIWTFLVCVVYFVGFYKEPFSFTFILKLRYKSPRIMRISFLLSP
jgi:hypothetical protein